MSWQQDRKISTLPGVKVDPVLALARTLEKAQAGTIKSVYIGIEWEHDGSFVGEWSSMPTGTLGCHAKVAEKEFESVLYTGKPSE